MRYTSPPGLSQAEAQELQAQLAPGEWEALATVQQMLTESAVLAPDPGFSNRVLTRLATRQRVRAQRRDALGVLIFGLGSMLLTSFLIWSSGLVEISSWVNWVNGITFLIPASRTAFFIGGTLFTNLMEGIGGLNLMLFALFSVGLALLWTSLVSRSNPLTRPMKAMGGLLK